MGVLLPPADASGGFVAGGAAGVAAAIDQLGSNVRIDVRHGDESPPDDAWEAVLCHGVQWTGWIRDHRLAPGVPVVMTDRLVAADVDETLAEVTMVDWCWDQAAYLAGVAASITASGRPVGIVAGPPVLTQRRVVAAYLEGLHDAGHTGTITSTFLRDFADVAGGELAGRQMAGQAVGVLAHAADRPGEVAVEVVRRHGASSIGFIEPLGEHVATVASDVSGVVHELLLALVNEKDLPRVYAAGLDSGHLELMTGTESLNAALEPFRERARRIGS